MNKNVTELQMKNVIIPRISRTVVNNICNLVTVQVYGSFSTAKIYVEGLTAVGSNQWEKVAVVDKNLNEPVIGTDGITSAGIYQAAIEGLKNVRINIESVTGTVSVDAVFSAVSDS